MRALFLLPLILVAGCSSIVRHNGDYFETGPDIARFEADNQACATLADENGSYTLRGISGTSYERNRTYNTVYAGCMTKLGYAPRAYARNWLPS